MALGWFLIGEGKLEEHLDEFPSSIDANAASDSVREARHRLKAAFRIRIYYCPDPGNNLSPFVSGSGVWTPKKEGNFKTNFGSYRY